MTNNYTPGKYLSIVQLDRLIDEYETLVVKYLYMMDQSMSAKLYMDVFSGYASCVATLTEYEIERDRKLTF